MADASFGTLRAERVIARSIALADDSGETRMIAMVDPDSAMAGLALTDLDGNTRLAISIDQAGRPNISFIRNDGVIGLTIGLSDDSPNVVFNYADSEDPVALNFPHLPQVKLSEVANLFRQLADQIEDESDEA